MSMGRKVSAGPLERTGGIRALSATAQQAPQVGPTGKLELGSAAHPCFARSARQCASRPGCWFELGLTLDRFCDAADR
jgi:hypothetical protein